MNPGGDAVMRMLRIPKIEGNAVWCKCPGCGAKHKIEYQSILTSGPPKCAECNMVMQVMDRNEDTVSAMQARAEKAEAELELAMQRLSDMGSSGAILDVAAERQRQITGEGWSAEHDDQHTRGELVGAAICYARGWIAAEWLWSLAWWKPKNRRYDLVRAAALLIAEIDRLDRARDRT